MLRYKHKKLTWEATRDDSVAVKSKNWVFNTGSLRPWIIVLRVSEVLNYLFYGAERYFNWVALLLSRDREVSQDSIFCPQFAAIRRVLLFLTSINRNTLPFKQPLRFTFSASYSTGLGMIVWFYDVVHTESTCSFQLVCFAVSENQNVL